MSESPPKANLAGDKVWNTNICLAVVEVHGVPNGDGLRRRRLNVTCLLVVNQLLGHYGVEGRKTCPAGHASMGPETGMDGR